MFEFASCACKEFAEERRRRNQDTAFAEYFDSDDYFSYACFAPEDRDEYRDAEKYYYYSAAENRFYEFDTYEQFDDFCRRKGF